MRKHQSVPVFGDIVNIMESPSESPWKISALYGKPIHLTVAEIGPLSTVRIRRTISRSPHTSVQILFVNLRIEITDTATFASIMYILFGVTQASVVVDFAFAHLCGVGMQDGIC